jgi:arylsulfatase A-like enzyme
MKNLLGFSPIPRNKISLSNQEWLRNTYWNAIANADNAIGELVAHLKKLNIYDNSLIVITGDHGESLFDDGVLGHGYRINNQQLKIPFVTNIKTRSIAGPIGQTDMREILLDLINHDQDMTLTENKIKHRQAVFHFIGSISKPVQISHTYSDDRIIFDFRTRKVMLEGNGGWQQINTFTKHPQHSKMFNELIFEWEYLIYQDSLSD